MKKILSLILCFAMTMSSMTVPVMAFAEEVSDTPVQEAAAVSAVPISAKPDMTMPSVSFHDTANHWGTKAIDRWAGFGVIKGDERGNFNPDGDLNRAELATILTNLLGLTAKAANSYADVPANAWYADAVLKCTAAGIMKGDGINATPLANISRQESMVMIGRALGITPAATVDLAAFTDGSAVAPWAAPYVTTMLKAGIVNGVGENLVAPNANMSRAAVVTVLDKAISDYIKVAGTYDKLVGTGLVVVAAPGVVLKDGQVQNLLVAQGAADGSLTLENTNVIGNTMVLDNATVILKNSKLQTLEVLGQAAAITVGAGSEVANVAIAATAAGASLTVEKNALVRKAESSADRVTFGGAGTIDCLTVTGGKDVSVAKDTVVNTLENKSSNPVKQGDKIIAPQGTETKPTTSTGGGGGGGITVVGEFKTLAELQTAVQKNAATSTLTVSDVNTITAADDIELNVFATNTLTIDFKTVAAGAVTIIAPRVKTIYLKDAAGLGASFESLTIKAPLATVTNDVTVNGELKIEAVSNNTMNQNDLVGKVQMAGTGTLSLGSAAGMPAVDITTKEPVTLGGSNPMGPVTVRAEQAVVKVTGSAPSINATGGGANITMETSAPVALSGAIESVSVTRANAGVNVAAGSTVNTVTATAAATLGGDGAITNVNAAADMTINTKNVKNVEATQAVILNTPVEKLVVPAKASGAAVGGSGAVQELFASASVVVSNPAVTRVSVPVGADANTAIGVAKGVILPVIETTQTLEIKGEGGVSSVDVNNKKGEKAVEVFVSDTAKVVVVASVGTGEITTRAAATASVPAREQIVTKAIMPATLNIAFLPPVAANGTGIIQIGQLDGLSLECKASTESQWSNVIAGDTVKPAGTYYVRVAAQENADGTVKVLASEPVYGVIPAAIGVSAASISGNALVGQTLTANYNADATGAIHYAWKADGKTIGGDTKTLILANDQVGATVTVAISNYAAEENGQANNSKKTAVATAAVTADKTALNTAINVATAAKAGIIEKAPGTLVTNVALGVIFVPTGTTVVLDQAIAAAKTTAGGNLTTEKVKQAIGLMNDAAAAFNKAKQVGAQTEVTDLQAAVNAAITAAEQRLQNAPPESLNGEDVAPAAFWITATAKANFQKEITAATTAKTSADPVVLSKAITDLSNATKVFAAAKRNGMPLDVAALQAAITAAEANVSSVVVDTLAENISPNQKWVLAAAKTNYLAAIQAAKTAMVSTAATTQQEIKAALPLLNAATAAFEGATQKGTKGDVTALKAAIEKARANQQATQGSTDGKDIPANKAWALPAAITAYGNAITAAESVGGIQETVNKGLAALNEATAVFNSKKHNKIDFLANQVILPGAGEKVVSAAGRTDTVALTATVPTGAAPVGIDFNGIFSPKTFRAGADQYAAISLTQLFGSDAGGYTVLQTNPALCLYQADQTEANLDAVAGTKIRYGYVAADTYDFLVTKGNTPIELKIYQGDQVAHKAGAKDSLKAAAPAPIQTILIDTKNLVIDASATDFVLQTEADIATALADTHIKTLTLGADLALTKDLTFPVGKTLIIPFGKTLTNNGGVTLTNNGLILNNNGLTNKGILTNNGTITNEKTIANEGPLTNSELGTVTNHGTITNGATLTNDGSLTNDGIIRNGNTGTVAGKNPIISNVSTEEGLAAAFAIGGTVKLNADISGVTKTSLIPAGCVVTLDLNGKSITVTDNFLGRPVQNNGTLTVLGNGTIDSSASRDLGYGAIDNYGTITIENGTFSGSLFSHGAALKNRADATATINGGTFKNATAALANEGTCTINDGIFESIACNRWTDINGDSLHCYCVISSGVLTINNATITGVQGALAIQKGKATINNGTFTARLDEHGKKGVGCTFYALYVAGERGQVEATINGGTYVSEQRNAVLVGNDADGGDKAPATAYIKGGTFTGVGSAVEAAPGTGNPAITGGTFSSFVGDYARAGAKITVMTNELNKDILIPADVTVTIPAGETVTIPTGKTLTNNGTLVNDGTIVNDGTFTNNGILSGTGATAVTNVAQLVAAVAVGGNIQVAAGTYDLPKTVVYNAQGVDEEWYLPILKPVHLIGIADANGQKPLLTSTTYSANGVWASQNFITVFADDVTIDGFDIKTKKEANKVIEVSGKNFNLKNSNLLENEEGTSGLIYFTGLNTLGQTKDMGDIVLENLKISKGDISYRDNAWGGGALSGTLSFLNVQIDNQNYGIPFNYGAIVHSDNPNNGIVSAALAVTANGLVIRLNGTPESDVPFHQAFRDTLPATGVEVIVSK